MATFLVAKLFKVRPYRALPRSSSRPKWPITSRSWCKLWQRGRRGSLTRRRRDRREEGEKKFPDWVPISRRLPLRDLGVSAVQSPRIVQPIRGQSPTTLHPIKSRKESDVAEVERSVHPWKSGAFHVRWPWTSNRSDVRTRHLGSPI